MSCFPRRLFLLALLAASPPGAAPAAAEEPLTRILFGSCIKQERPTPIWEGVLKQKPELFVLLGDNIYGDTEDMDLLRAKYETLGAQPGFRRLREACPLLATWDDHDYGVNDGGVEYPQKEASQRVFCDFFGVPEDSPRRRRPGVYDAASFGPPGRRVQLILLDTRYFRSPLAKWPGDARQTPGPYAPTDDPAATLLGEEQWTWLADVLREPAEVRLIASSIQVVPSEHGWEMWANFPRERERLFRTIADAGAGGVIFLSGDRHLAEISRLPADESPVGYPLYDATSSSLNQPSGGGNEGEPNRTRVADQFFAVNFGCVEIDWTADDPRITLAIHDVAGERARAVAVSLSELQPQPRR